VRNSLACIFVFLVAGCTPAPPEVRVDGEALIGRTVAEGNVAAFLGVPYAEPPVGELRWRAPQPLSTRLAHRDAVDFPPACMQSMRILDWYRYMAETFGGSADYYDDLAVSEDCLYLNIWTPSLDDDAKLPVLVWVHGGSNNSGWSYELNYHGHNLAERGVVVVSIAYRLGVFGFFSHPDLPREYAALFAGRPLAEQFAMQAAAERAGAATWRALAEKAAPEQRAVFEACAGLEEASAAVLDALVAEGAGAA